jgi:uncharacterized protein YjbJ (UPF0337 family)
MKDKIRGKAEELKGKARQVTGEVKERLNEKTGETDSEGRGES